MARIIRSAKTLLSPTSETPTSPITADLVRPTPSPLPSDLAVPSLGHDGVYGYDLKGKKAASPLHVPVPTENTGKFIPLMKKLSRDSSKSKKSSLELSPQTPASEFAGEPPAYSAQPIPFTAPPEVIKSPVRREQGSLIEATQ